MMAKINYKVEATFYVAPNGNDGWSGKLAEPNAMKTEGPFATLGRARDAAREVKGKQAPKEPITVIVRGGKYYLDQTLVFSSEDSGSREFPITYKAYPGEKPILSGGKRITGWKPYKGKILQAELVGSRGGKWKSRQLFLNGERQIRSRYPKFDAKDPLYGGWVFLEGPAEKGSTTSFICKPGTFKQRWGKPSEGEVFVFPCGGWTSNIVPIKTIDENRRIITLTRAIQNPDRAPWFYPQPFLPGDRFRVENLLEELSEPGEWCLDSEEGVIYFWPPGGSIKSTDEIVVPALDTLMDIHGALWLVISGFTFTETSGGDDMHRDGLDGYGPMYPNQGWKYCGEALHLREAEHCVIEKNHFYAVGGNAIYLERYNGRNVIRRNEISYAGANGICLLGNYLRNLVPGYVADKDVPKLPWLRNKQAHPMFNEVVDNYIHHCGGFNKYVAAVFLGISDGNLIAHNRIEFTPHHAINLSQNGYGRNIVEYNEIHQVNLETADNGGINSWMDNETSDERAGHIIRFNLIADIVGCHTERNGRIVKGSGAHGIYLDNYTSNSVVYGNIIVRPSGAGIMVHAGRNNVMENNIIVDPAHHGQVSYAYAYNPIPGFMTGHRFCRNIVYYSKHNGPFFTLYEWSDQTVANSNDNVFFRPGVGERDLPEAVREFNSPTTSRPAEGRKLSLEDWKRMGYDENSLVADPLFVDPQNDDYRLKPTSPAIRLGFIPIDVARIGIRNQSQTTERGER